MSLYEITICGCRKYPYPTHGRDFSYAPPPLWIFHNRPTKYTPPPPNSAPEIPIFPHPPGKYFLFLVKARNKLIYFQGPNFDAYVCFLVNTSCVNCDQHMSRSRVVIMQTFHRKFQQVFRSGDFVLAQHYLKRKHDNLS